GLDLIELNLSSSTARSLLKSNPDFTFTALNHPEYGPIPGANLGVIFAGIANGQAGGYHLYGVDTQSGRVIQLTSGASDDRNASVNPDSSMPVIAFDSDRNDPNGNSTKGTRDI